MHAAERVEQEARSRSVVAARRAERRVRACVSVHGRAKGGARGLGKRGGGERLARERGKRGGELGQAGPGGVQEERGRPWVRAAGEERKREGKRKRKKKKRKIEKEKEREKR